MQTPAESFKPMLCPSKNTDWFGAQYTIDLYQGCSHGCIYCESRGVEVPAKDFEKVQIHNNALKRLEDELRASLRTGIAAVGYVSDPYLALEKEKQYTRAALQQLLSFGFGTVIVTKSDLIERDLDVILKIKAYAPVLCALTITTCSSELAKKIEPAAPLPKERLRALKQLSRAGIYTGVLLMPVLPFIEDSEENVREVVYSAAVHGARFVYPMLGVNLHSRQREFYYQKLDRLFPNSKYAQEYQKKYATRYKCSARGITKLTQVFREEVRARGLLCDMRDIVAGYKEGYGYGQLSFL